MSKTMASVFTSASILVLCNVAFAVEYQFAGVVTSVHTAFSFQVSPGEIVSGHMSLTQLSSSPVQAAYAVSNFTANIGAHYPITSNGGFLRIVNNFGGATDQVLLEVHTLHGLTAPLISGHVPEYLTFNLLYDVNDLSSTNLLTQFVFADPLDRSGLRFDVNGSLSIRFKLNDFSRVPEPSAILLALASSGALRVARRKNKPIP